MKNLLLSAFLLGLALVPQSVLAADLNCDTDIVSGVPLGADWNEQYILRGDDGSAWQRAIISQPVEDFNLKEGENFEISGTADHNSEVQVFIFAPQANGSGGVRRPGPASCFSAGKANMQNHFKLEMPSQAIWDGVGGQVYVDAYFKMDQLWDQQKAVGTDDNFFIGTHNLPTQADIRVHLNLKKGCEMLCKGIEGSSNIQKAIIIDPSKWPQVENGNFEEVDGEQVALGNFDHTFYAGTKAEPEEEVMANLSLKVLTMEVLKRFLTGELSGSKPAMEEITANSMRQAAGGSGYARDIQALAANIKTAMISELFSPEREAALDFLVAEFEQRLGCNSGQCVLPTRNTFFEIFPPQQSETEWDDLFIDLLLMWTDRTDLNQCILPDEKLTQVKKSFYFQGHHHRLVIWCDWIMSYTHGYSSPAILIERPEAAKLEPDFTGIRITSSDTGFTDKTGWQLPAGAKEPIFYRYEQLAAIEARELGSACVRPSRLNDFVGEMAAELGLSEAARIMAETELRGQLQPVGEDYHRFTLVDPTSIGRHFGWQLDGEPANIRQVFFRVEHNSCDEDHHQIEYPPSIMPEQGQWDGTEIGVLR